MKSLKENLSRLNFLGLFALILGISLLLAGCTEELDFETRPTNGQNLDDPTGSNEPGDGDDTRINDEEDPSGEDDPPIVNPCSLTSQYRTDSFALTPDAIEGANIVFILDDSGSMTGEFQKVVWEIQSFVNNLLSATENNYRIAMVYDHTKAAIAGRTFYRDREQTDRINDANPFADQILTDEVAYFQKETWSKHADVAFARVFMPGDFMQILPDPIPADTPNDSVIRAESLAILPTDCQGAGKYFRPRDFTSDYGFGTTACIQAQSQVNLADHLLPDFNVNVVTVSDDDLNVKFDRANFDPVDVAKNAYPEIVDLMFQEIVSPLGDDVSYIYHSIVGPIGSQSGADVDKDGVAHLALSKRTGGATFDIRANDWQPLFESLTEQIIYSEQEGLLACRPNSTGIEVRLNEQLIDSSLYALLTAQKKIRLLPGAFEGFPSGTPIQVKVRYKPSGS